MRDIGAFGLAVAVLFIFTTGDAYAQTPDVYTSNQTTLTDNLKNNPMAQEILKKIEQIKKQIAQLKEKENQRQEDLEELKEGRQRALASLEQSLEQWEKLWGQHTFEYKFKKLSERADEFGTNVFWDQYNFTHNKILAGQKAYNTVLQNGGSIIDARDAYIDAAKTTRAELIEVNSLFNVKHNLALYNQQIMFDRNGQFHEIVSGEELRKYYGDFRTNPAYLDANPDDDTARKDMSRDSDTECRENYSLVYRFHAEDYVCVTDQTAELWIKIGMGKSTGDEPNPSLDSLTVEKLRQDRINEKIKNINEKIQSRYSYYEQKLSDVEASYDRKYQEINQERRAEEKKILKEIDILSGKEISAKLTELREKYDVLYQSSKQDRERSLDIMKSSNKDDMEVFVDEFDSVAGVNIVWDSDDSSYKAVKQRY